MKQHKIYSENIDENALNQFYEALDQPYSIKGALMADAHLGYGLPIGGVVATEGAIVPAWVGYDIGCGMCAIPLDISLEMIKENSIEIFNGIYRDIPTGFKHRAEKVTWNECSDIPITDEARKIFDKKGGLHQMATLGGGNHFIEIGHDENDRVWLIIHSGSRGIGHGIATHYMRIAGGGKVREGNWALSVDSEEGRNYIVDLNFCLAFALENRRQMLCYATYVIQKITGHPYVWEGGGIINRNHNHAELKDGLWIHRKGATHAEKGMMGVIPGNMRDGSFIVEGKGNEESLNSSSHGAGRVLGRKQAKRELNMNDFKETMKGIVAKVEESTLDEAPMAYKSIYEVMDCQKDLLEVKHTIKPLINVKA